MWVLILIAGSGYALQAIPGFTSEVNCRAAEAQIVAQSKALAEAGNYSYAQDFRIGISRAHCIQVR